MLIRGDCFLMVAYSMAYERAPVASGFWVMNITDSTVVTVLLFAKINVSNFFPCDNIKHLPLLFPSSGSIDYDDICAQHSFNFVPFSSPIPPILFPPCLGTKRYIHLTVC